MHRAAEIYTLKLHESLILFFVNLLNVFVENISRNFKGSGGYILQTQGDGKFILVDAFQPIIRLGGEMNLENLRGILNEFHITDIFVDSQINLGDALKKFIDDCGVPVRAFTISAK